MGNANQAYLRYGADQKFHLSAGRLCQIGRSLANEVVVQDAEVSRHHASVEARETEFILSDAGSRNGTFLNGAKIQGPMRLKPGDRIEVGNTQIVFEWPGAPGMGGVAPFHEDATIATTLIPPSHFTVVLTMNGFAKVASQADPAKLDAALVLCRDQVDEILRRERLNSLRFAGDLVILDADERGGPGSPDLLERVCSAASDIAIALEQLPAHAQMMGRIQVSGGVHLAEASGGADDTLQQAIALAAQASKAGTVLYLNALAADRVKSRFADIAESLQAGSSPGSFAVQFFHLQQVVQG